MEQQVGRVDQPLQDTMHGLVTKKFVLLQGKDAPSPIACAFWSPNCWEGDEHPNNLCAIIMNLCRITVKGKWYVLPAGWAGHSPIFLQLVPVHSPIFMNSGHRNFYAKLGDQRIPQFVGLNDLKPANLVPLLRLLIFDREVNKAHFLSYYKAKDGFQFKHMLKPKCVRAKPIRTCPKLGEVSKSSLADLKKSLAEFLPLGPDIWPSRRLVG